MCHPYIESATASLILFFDDDEEIARIYRCCRSVELDFQHLAGSRNMSVD